MQQPAQTINYDVVIIGAGPAGSACALALKDAGLKVALLDKHSFPRDKVCGDAIPGRAIKVLKSINPAFEDDFRMFADKCETKKTKLFYKGRELTFHWVRPAYTCTRMAFDHYLLSLVRHFTSTDILTDTLPDKLTVKSTGIVIPLKNANTVLETKLLIGADGAQSTVAKQLTHKALDRDHYVGSVRAYFSNVANTQSDLTEIYFDSSFLPSYLWVFPIPGNMANVGFGMLSSEISKRKINLKKAFYEFIDRSPELKAKFKDAVQEGPLDGFGLPLGSNVGTISGANFMLIGDAASLIDPVSGDGIGNAMLSGKHAAEQAARCFRQNNFTAGFIKEYDRKLLAVIGPELRTHHRAQKILSRMPLLLDLIFLAGKNKALLRLMQRGL